MGSWKARFEGVTNRVQTPESPFVYRYRIINLNYNGKETLVFKRNPGNREVSIQIKDMTFSLLYWSSPNLSTRGFY